MASQFFKGYSILLYLLAIIVFFFSGLFYAGMIEAGKGQGLAGGAIVLSYGVVASFIALLISIFLASRLSKKLVIRLNILLGITMLALLFAFMSKIKKDSKLGYIPKQEVECHKTFLINFKQKAISI